MDSGEDHDRIPDAATRPPRPDRKSGFTYSPYQGELSDLQGVLSPIRIRAVENLEFPLWDAEDYLGDDFEWLRHNLGLTRETYDALLEWQIDFEALGTEPPEREAHRHRAEELRARLELEVGPKFRVVVQG